ncbi:hypothetical protein J1N35_025663 [Gossypium stocksii]|uniref:Uncharacterized protein n=1 Tax=Gossypium stocksii TaxID=47602 RepID=A0A9D3ZWE9_9ROSI|nr:hypothetical protein J1N35_025663 [Gossypium stocksii]
METHKCSITFKNKRVSYKFVGEHCLSKIRVIPKLKLTEMQKLAKEELKIKLSRGTCSKARKWALEEINGRVCYEFNRLWYYVNALRKVDPDGDIEVMVERPTSTKVPKFRRFYVWFSALRKEFLECCRLFICLDRCLLKGSRGNFCVLWEEMGLMEEISELLPRVKHRVCEGIYMPTGGKKILEETNNNYFGELANPT